MNLGKHFASSLPEPPEGLVIGDPTPPKMSVGQTCAGGFAAGRAVVSEDRQRSIEEVRAPSARFAFAVANLLGPRRAEVKLLGGFFAHNRDYGKCSQESEWNFCRRARRVCEESGVRSARGVWRTRVAGFSKKPRRNTVRR